MPIEVPIKPINKKGDSVVLKASPRTLSPPEVLKEYAEENIFEITEEDIELFTSPDARYLFHVDAAKRLHKLARTRLAHREAYMAAALDIIFELGRGNYIQELKIVPASNDFDGLDLIQEYDPIRDKFPEERELQQIPTNNPEDISSMLHHVSLYAIDIDARRGVMKSYNTEFLEKEINSLEQLAIQDIKIQGLPAVYFDLKTKMQNTLDFWKDREKMQIVGILYEPLKDKSHSKDKITELDVKEAWARAKGMDRKDILREIEETFPKYFSIL